MFQINHNIPQIKNKLLRLRKLVGESPNWQDDMVKVAEQAVHDLKMLTPRSKERTKGKHTADGWKLRHVGRSGKDRVPIITAVWNDYTHRWKSGSNRLEKKGLNPRPNALLKTAKGHVKPYTLLEVLEYGSPPHSIDPVKGKFIKFDIGGKTIFTKHVDHPGTRPHGMVRITRAKTIARLALYGRKWLRKIHNDWTRG